MDQTGNNQIRVVFLSQTGKRDTTRFSLPFPVELGFNFGLPGLIPHLFGSCHVKGSLRILGFDGDEELNFHSNFVAWGKRRGFTRIFVASYEDCALHLCLVTKIRFRTSGNAAITGFPDCLCIQRFLKA